MLELADSLAAGDAKQVLSFVDEIGDPHDLMDALADDKADEAGSGFTEEAITHGFFQFIDFISALFLRLGPSSIEVAQRHRDTSTGQYVAWVVRFCIDERFANDIRSRFAFLDVE